MHATSSGIKFTFSQNATITNTHSLIDTVYLFLKVRNHLEDLVAKLTLEDQLSKEVLVFELVYSFFFVFLFMKVFNSSSFVRLD